MEHTSASQAGVIVSCLPLIVAVLAFFMLKERISRAIIVGFTLVSVAVFCSLCSLLPLSMRPTPLLATPWSCW